MANKKRRERNRDTKETEFSTMKTSRRIVDADPGTQRTSVHIFIACCQIPTECRVKALALHW